MTRYRYPAPPAPDFESWKKQGEEAVIELWEIYRAGKPLCSNHIKEKLYKTYKQEILAAFNGKCAFCESRILATQPGDVEHYRPKLQIQEPIDDEHNQVVEVNFPGRGKVPHPGYFWLAYSWENLIPACANCNRRHKRNFFPVESPGGHAKDPDEIADERPLLINPAVDDPSDHIELDPADFHLRPKTTRGRKTIDILELNRIELVAERKSTYINVWLHLWRYLTIRMSQPMGHPAADDLPAELRSHFSMLESFTLVALAAREGFDEQMRKIASK